MPRPAPWPLVTAALSAAAALLALACQRPSGPGDSPVAVSADSAAAPADLARGRPAEPSAPGALARPPGSLMAVMPSSNPLVASLTASACQPLPAARPADWSVRFERATLPIHAPPTREGVTVATSCAGRDRPCQQVAPADLDALYATFQRLAFSGDWEVNARDVRSPHHGSRELTARWGQVECRVHDGRATWVDPAHEDDFRALADALVAASDRARAGRPVTSP